MDANSGKPWSEMDLEDLEHSLYFGDTVAATASFLCRDEDEVREKMKELGFRLALVPCCQIAPGGLRLSRRGLSNVCRSVIICDQY
jgi:hypothetical protein